MERIGVLIVTYGSRGAAIVDALCRSEEYRVVAYIADKNQNPFNIERAERHVVIPDLDIQSIYRFAYKYRNEIDFGIVGPEQPIINGLRDLIEKQIGTPLICPTQKYAIERSKVEQRQLFEEITPEINPRFKVFDPKEYSSVKNVQRAVWKWLDELNNQVVVKPDGVTAGKGVGVWGDHFTDRRALFEHFLSNYKYGSVILEEKLVGEESSFQCFCDGRRLIPLPETRDYKRAFEGDRGPNTGGMGSYRDRLDWLPFMTSRDKQREIEVMNRIFRKLKGRGSNPDLRGIPFYGAFIHTREGPKILENNSRPGDPEIMNILPLLQDDFVDLCYRLIDGTLTKINVAGQASVVTYKVPPTYGGKSPTYSGSKRVYLERAHDLCKELSGTLKLYPGSLELRDGKLYSLSSRTIAAVGIANTIAAARQISLQGINAIEGTLWYRTDIASKAHISRSITRMKRLRTS